MSHNYQPKQPTAPTGRSSQKPGMNYISTDSPSIDASERTKAMRREHPQSDTAERIKGHPGVVGPYIRNGGNASQTDTATTYQTSVHLEFDSLSLSQISRHSTSERHSQQGRPEARYPVTNVTQERVPIATTRFHPEGTYSHRSESGVPTISAREYCSARYPDSVSETESSTSNASLQESMVEASSIAASFIGSHPRAPRYEEYDSFMYEHKALINEYSEIRASYSKHNQRISKCIFAATIIVRGLQIFSGVNSIVGGVANAANLILTTVTTAKENDQMVYAVIFEIVDLIHDILRMREITFKTPDKEFRVKQLLDTISNDITQCQTQIGKFCRRATMMKILLATYYADIFKEHASGFSKHRAKFHDAVGLYTAHKVTSTAEGVTDIKIILKLVRHRMDQFHSDLFAERQRNAIEHFTGCGGVKQCIGANHHTKELGGICGQDIDERSIAKIQKELLSMAETLKDVKAYTRNISDGVAHLNEQFVKLTGDKEVDGIIKRFFVQDHFTFSIIFALEFDAFFKNYYLPSHPEYWMIALVHPSQVLMDAFDENGSGSIDHEEVKKFGRSRPKDWSLLRWTACWTTGWSRTIVDCRQKIQLSMKNIRELESPSAHVISPKFNAFVDMLLHRTKHVKTFKENIGSLEYLGRVLYVPEDEISHTLESVNFFLESSEGVMRLCKDRIEFWIFSMVKLALRNYETKLERNKWTIYETSAFYTTQDSIVAAFNARASRLLHALQFSGKDPSEFAFGMFSDTKYARSNENSMNENPDRAHRIGHAGVTELNRIQQYPAPLCAPIDTVRVNRREETSKISTQARNMPQPNLSQAKGDASRNNFVGLMKQSYSTLRTSDLDTFILEPLGSPTLQDSFSRLRRSTMWHPNLDPHVRSMLASGVVGPSTLVLENPMFCDLTAPPDMPYANCSQPHNFIRIGDLGVVQKSGIFHRVLNIFDRIAPGHDGLGTRLNKSFQFATDMIPGRKVYRSSSMDLRVVAAPKEWPATYKIQMQSFSSKGNVIIIPNGGTEKSIPYLNFIETPIVQGYLQEYAPTWYNIALQIMGPDEMYNGALTLVRCVHVTDLCYRASFLSEPALLNSANATLEPVGDINSYLWSCLPDNNTPKVWSSSRHPHNERIREGNEGSRVLEECFALTLSPVELDQKSWAHHFAARLPNSSELYRIANSAPSVRSNPSTITERARKALRFSNIFPK